MMRAEPGLPPVAPSGAMERSRSARLSSQVTRAMNLAFHDAFSTAC
jgi:hypothetical protein